MNSLRCKNGFSCLAVKSKIHILYFQWRHTQRSWKEDIDYKAKVNKIMWINSVWFSQIGFISLPPTRVAIKTDENHQFDLEAFSFISVPAKFFHEIYDLYDIVSDLWNSYVALLEFLLINSVFKFFLPNFKIKNRTISNKETRNKKTKF